MTRSALFLPFRLAGRELRAGTHGFRLFIACLILGVAAIAGVGSISTAAITGIAANAKAILGGDMEVRLTHRAATPDELAAIERLGEISHVIEMRAMAKPTSEGALPVLVELKGADDVYPLYGALTLTEQKPLAELLAKQPDGTYGALAHRVLLQRAHLKVGDRLIVGNARFAITGAIEREPDSTTQVFAFGPRLLISQAALDATGLVQPGSLVYHSYRIKMPPTVDRVAAAAALNAEFPNAGWRIRQLEDAGARTRNFLENTRAYLDLIGLSALLIGGLGIANAVRAHLEGKARTIAMLKCIGATSGQIASINLITIGVMAGISIVIALAIGAAAPFIFQASLAQMDVDLATGIYPVPLLRAAAFGALTALAFSLPSLLRARRTKPAQLFRAAAIELGTVNRKDVIAVGTAGLALAAVVVATAENKVLSAGFALAAIATLAAFRGLATIIQAAAHRGQQRLKPGRSARALRFALATLGRRSAPVASIVLSIGLGLTVIIVVALIQHSILNDFARSMPARAPSFYFIDIQPDQVAGLESTVMATPGANDFERVPMLRGRIVRMNDVSVDKITPPKDHEWVLRGDRGLTWSAAPPPDANIVAGDWWPSDYKGDPLISLDQGTAEAFGLKIGDSITVNLLGREVTGKIANLRAVDWSTFSINFVMVFSPGLMESAPQTSIATVRVPEDEEGALMNRVAAQYPNISAIRVKDALATALDLLTQVGGAIRGTALATLGAGILVLAGAVAAGREKRIYEAVLLKMLGGRRRDIAFGYVWEFALLALVSVALAIVLGSFGAWLFLKLNLETPLVVEPVVLAGVLALALALALVLGFWGSWRALGAKAAPFLRNE
ncbi:ABC transporter permease [Dongia deserti]|uniref:ABC transporter permease n=1 Tax=Dongia deserti TaxID=2268030 RepID=UPI0013C3F78B|nr:FtsX-like permease family protein [Dongia deserti]